MRFRALLMAALLGAALIAALARPARSAPQSEERVTAIEPPAPPEALAQVPALSAPSDLSSLVGRTVTRVTVVVSGNTLGRPIAAPTLQSLKAGETLTPAAARRAMDELLASGRFAHARVSAEADRAGVALVLQAVPRALIARIRVDLHGGARIEREEMLREADLTEDGEILGDQIAGDSMRMERYLALHGYPAATVRIQTRETDDEMRVLLFVDVHPGPPLVIESRRFVFTARTAAPSVSVEDVYPVRRGDRADLPLIDEADASLAQDLRGHGFTHAEVSHELVRISGPARPDVVELRVRIDAGALSVPRFEGNEHYDADVLLSVLGLQTDVDRSPVHLADKLRVFYEKRGFLDADVRTELRGGAADPIQIIVFHIAEGRRVRVAGREYPCLQVDAIKSLSAGGPRSPEEIGNEINSYLDEDLPGADFFVSPNPVGLSQTIGGRGDSWGRAVPIDLSPHEVYTADSYDRAVAHVQELYRNEGFLHAQIGPVQVVRSRCDPRSPAQSCVPSPMTTAPSRCTYDTAGLPLPGDPSDPARACRPDPAHGVECAPTLRIVIPVKLGPRSRVWDLAFTGVHGASERDVAAAAQLPLGDPASTTKLEDARRRIVDWYKELGYYYADVKYALEPSADSTRVRARFDVVEGDRVIVRSIVINGLQRTDEGVVRRRVALEPGAPYRTSDVRKTQERVATLGVFASASVSLSDPYVPQANKDVVIDVIERSSQYIEVRPGLSTGEGLRGAFEYGHRNLLGYAWSVTLHLEASYLPDFLILDPGVAQNYKNLGLTDRIATRDTLTFSWPEVGLGPTVRAQLDGVFVHDLERDFTLTKSAVVGTLFWRPSRELQISIGPEFEHNDVLLFGAENIATYLAENQGNADLAALLRFPDGASNVIAEQLNFTWDRRDNSFNAHRGTYVGAGIEQVNSYPVPVTGSEFDLPPQYVAHFFRLTQTLRAYLPITSEVTFASELRMGEVLPTACSVVGGGAAPTYCTYEDRLFFMGGFDSMRGWLQDSFIPQDFVDQIARTKNQAICVNSDTNCPGVAVRGGNLMINPRFELRFPIRRPIDGALFGDLGYLWNDPSRIGRETFLHNIAPRADVGAGVRVDTPVGPLVFDYGINVTRRSYEDFGAFHFAIGLF
jgi:outer membrane protein assembly factor BamA